MVGNASQVNEYQAFEARAAYQFYTQINAIIPASKDLLKKRLHFFHDNYKSERKMLTDLVDLIQKYRELVVKEETARPKYIVPRIKIRKYKNAKNNVELTKNQLEQVSGELEREKDRLMQERAGLENKLNVEKDKLQSDSKLVDSHKKYSECDNRRQVLMIKIDGLEAEIDAKCCHCAPWRARKQRKELKKSRTALSEVQLQLKELGADNDEYKSRAANIASLETELSSLVWQVAAFIGEMPIKIQKLNDEYREAQIELMRAESDKENNRAEYYASVSEAVTIKVIEVYKAFLIFKEKIDLLAKGKSEAEAKKCVQLGAQLGEIKLSLDTLMSKIWCRGMANKSADIIRAERDIEKYPELSLAI